MRALSAALAAALVLTACNGSDPDPQATPTATETTTGTPSGTASPRPSVSGLPTPPPVASAALRATVARFGAKRLAWTGCGEGFQCARLTVPLDYDKPNGDTLDISVLRLPASGQKIGSLVLNPGGPGGSGVEFARQARQLLPAEVRARFDVVGFDPRGVGESEPVDCLTDEQMDRLLAADPTPDDARERKELIDVTVMHATGCERRAAKLLPHVGTVDAAKDIDVLRTALGDDKLTYLGFSYGTLLGARYAQQFPGNIRAFVLDGAVDPVLTARETAIAQAIGFERALDAFFDDCAASRCAFSRHGDIGKTYDDLMADIDRSPLSAASYPGRRLGPSEALFGVAAGLYSREYGWPVLRQALEAARAQRDGSMLLALFDNLVERDEDGRYSGSVESQMAVTCVDSLFDDDVEAYDKDAATFAKQAPRFGEALAYGAIVCSMWPAPPVTRPGVAQAPGAPPILVVGTTRDPATPYSWSQSLAAQLPGVLLTYDGDGHTAYGYGRSSCIERAVNAYLISLTVPKAGTRCG